MILMVYCWIGECVREKLDGVHGWETFGAIYRRRPMGFRYAVCLDGKGGLIVFDLLDAREKMGHLENEIIPGRYWEYQDYDQAIAATILTYGNEGS